MTKTKTDPVDAARAAHVAAVADFTEAKHDAEDAAEAHADLLARLDNGDTTVSQAELTAARDREDYTGRIARAKREATEGTARELSRQRAISSPDVAEWLTVLLGDAARALNIYGLPVEALPTHPDTWPAAAPAVYVWQTEPTKAERTGEFGGSALVAIRSPESAPLELHRLFNTMRDMAHDKGASVERYSVFPEKLAIFAATGLRGGSRSDYSAAVKDGVVTELWSVSVKNATPDVPVLPADSVSSRVLPDALASRMRSLGLNVGTARYQNVVADTEQSDGQRVRTVVAEVTVNHPHDIGIAVTKAHNVADAMAGDFVRGLGRCIGMECATTQGAAGEGALVVSDRRWRVVRVVGQFLYRVGQPDTEPSAPAKPARRSSVDTRDRASTSHPGMTSKTMRSA